MEQFLVFARSAYAEPLGFLGTLEAPAGQSPQQLAAETYGEEWVELVLIPEYEAHWAIQEAPARPAEVRP